ncbi:MAG: hypothetical protein HY023_07235 [Chloroflexi bacterium]|nr:hypothetical protein [Chloroflexota bacterium]MBI3738202.1 hypothetical protein [Chloroflexota bacterium]
MSDQPIEEKFEVKLKWPLEDSLQAVYANQFALSDFGPEIVIALGEFLPTGLPNRTKEEIEEYLANATIKPVVKIILSPTGLEAFFGLLKGYMDKKQQGE